jgi:hypothetical protein
MVRGVPAGYSREQSVIDIDTSADLLCVAFG